MILRSTIDKRGMWFIATANYADQIDRVLWDRIQVIRGIANDP